MKARDQRRSPNRVGFHRRARLGSTAPASAIPLGRQEGAVCPFEPQRRQPPGKETARVDADAVCQHFRLGYRRKAMHDDFAEAAAMLEERLADI
jgi:hypothetical protein